MSLFYYKRGKGFAPSYQDPSFTPTQVDTACIQNTITVCQHIDKDAEDFCMIEWCITKDEKLAKDALDNMVKTNKDLLQVGESINA